MLNNRPFLFFNISDNTTNRILSLYCEVTLISALMFELTKKILVRVSFDPQLFQKELAKAIRWMTDSEEVQRLREWCIKEFGAVYPSIVHTAFSSQVK